MKPFIAAMQRALEKNSATAVGRSWDTFHYQQASTSAHAERKLRSCDAYLTVHSDEAGPLLCPALASGGTAGPHKYVDLTFYLNAAHGNEYSRGTLLERQRLEKENSRPPHPAEPVAEPCGVTLDPTNFHILFLQQELYFETWWAQLAARKPMGLAQRCLFCFGCRSRCLSWRPTLAWSYKGLDPRQQPWMSHA